MASVACDLFFKQKRTLCHGRPEKAPCRFISHRKNHFCQSHASAVFFLYYPMPSPNRLISIDVVSVLKVIGILLLLVFAYLIRDVLALVVVSLFLAALIIPAARCLAKYKIPKGATVIAIYLLLFGCATLIIGLLLPPLIEQASQLVGVLGKSWNAISGSVHALQEFSARYGLTDNLQAGVQTLEGQIGRAVGGVFSTLTDIFGGIVGLIVVLVLTFYVVVEEEEARHALRNFLPEEYHELTSTIIERVEEKIGRWLLAQLFLMLMIGVTYSIGLSLIGLNAVLVLSVFGGFTEFIPYLGPVLGAIPILFIAVADSPLKAALALVVVILIQQLESHVIVPQVMRRAVGLNPIICITALLVGAKLFGLFGVFLAIPVATAASVTLTELYHYSKARRGGG